MPTTELARGQLLPHFDAATPSGDRLRYADLWQRRNLVLLVVDWHAAEDARRYVSELRARLTAVGADDTVAAAVRGPVPGLPDSTLIVSDRWGEVIDIEPLPGDASTWPDVADVVDWVDFIRRRCPECPP